MKFLRRKPTPLCSPASSRCSADRAGVTIVEVMMAAAVMALAITTSITTLQYGFRSIDTARNTTLGGQILQSMVEDIRMRPWADINDATKFPATKTGAISAFDSTGSFTNFNATAAAMLSRFTISQTVSDVSGQAGMKVIVLTAVWNGVDGRSHSVKYTTYYAQSGLYDYYYN